MSVAMPVESAALKIFACGLLLISGGAASLLGTRSPAAAQVPVSDSPCYLRASDGRQYDLTALCPGFENSQSVEMQTDDLQVTLPRNTSDDLDLVDVNAGCTERMAAPVENIFWPTGGGVPGNDEVEVDLFSPCGPGVAN